MKKNRIPGPKTANRHTASSVQGILDTAARLYSSGRYAETLDMVKKLLKHQPNNVVGMNIAAICSMYLGKSQDAEDYWKKAVQIKPDYADAHCNLGKLFHEQKRFTEAELAYRDVLAIQTDNAVVYNSLGMLLQEQKRFTEAEEAYQHAISIRPEYAEAYNSLGILLKKQKRFVEAEDAYRRAIATRPNYADAHNNLGNLLEKQKRFPEAEDAYRSAISIRSDFAEVHNNRGNLFMELKRFAEAEDAYRGAIAIRPDYADAHYNLGNLFKEQKRFVVAERAYRSVLSIHPDFAGAHTHNNLGILLQERKRFVEAEDAFRCALSIQPGNADIEYNLSLLLLSLGRFNEGLQLHEARLDKNMENQITKLPDLSFPKWSGQNLHGKLIVVLLEQGFGDNIQFVRYLTMLKSLGAARITLVCKLPLAEIFNNVPGADRVISGKCSVQLQPHDYWTFPLSLPLYFNTTLETIPADLPYLKAEEVKVKEWAAKLPATGFKVGLVWKGSPEHKNDSNRSLLGLECLAPLWSVPGVTFISLQKGAGEDEAANPPAGQPILHLGSDIKDFADTAAIVSQLDLVICVDTAVAHLAGALGKPVWVLIPSIGTDWRWMHDREDSPWYPGVMRLFRQTGMDDWTETIGKVASALGELISSPRPPLNLRGGEKPTKPLGQSLLLVKGRTGGVTGHEPQVIVTTPENTLIRPEGADKQQHTLQSGIPVVTSISMLRRVHDARFATRYFRGEGIDVGGGIDSLALCREFFPLVRHLFVYDQQHGAAQLLDNVPDASFDFLYSSHCLEHMGDPLIALKNWLRVVKPGGHLVITVPDEDLYEQSAWPSRFNPDHKQSFTICKKSSWSPASVNLLDLVREVCDTAQPLCIQLIDHGYRYGLAGKGLDQTRTPMAEAGIEVVLRKVAG